MEFLHKVRDELVSKVARYLLRRPMFGARPCVIRDKLNTSTSVGSQTCKEGIILAFPKDNIKENIQKFLEANKTQIPVDWNLEEMGTFIHQPALK